MRSLVAVVVSLVLAGVLAPVAPAVAGGDCHRTIAKGMAGIARGRIAQVGRCLKSLQYDSCIETDLHTAIHENELRNRVTRATSPCVEALDEGAVVADFGPTSCPAAWEDCDVEVPAITTLDEMVDCLVCQERGFDLAIRTELGMPRPAPDDKGERGCTRRIARMVSKTVRKSALDAMACGSGGAKPFACPVDPTKDSRFGKALSRFERSIARCGVEEGKAGDDLANLCGSDATDTATLTTCFEGLARCLACYTANAALGQSEDCAAFSGFARCDGMF